MKHEKNTETRLFKFSKNTEAKTEATNIIKTFRCKLNGVLNPNFRPFSLN